MYLRIPKEIGLIGVIGDVERNQSPFKNLLVVFGHLAGSVDTASDASSQRLEFKPPYWAWSLLKKNPLVVLV